jgi:hypothetical protein
MQLRTLGIALAILMGAWMISAFGLSAYDRHTRGELKTLVERELSPASGKDAMEAFMRRHVGNYHLDDRIDFEYAGIRRQTWADKLLFNRKVQVAVKFDPDTDKYVGCRISVFYTFL